MTHDLMMSNLSLTCALCLLVLFPSLSFAKSAFIDPAVVDVDYDVKRHKGSSVHIIENIAKPAIKNVEREIKAQIIANAQQILFAENRSSASYVISFSIKATDFIYDCPKKDKPCSVALIGPFFKLFIEYIITNNSTGIKSQAINEYRGILADKEVQGTLRQYARQTAYEVLRKLYSMPDADQPSIATRSSHAPRLFALVIGISRYKTISGLDYADRDAQAIRELIKEKSETPIIRYLENNTATFTNFQAEIKYLEQNADEDDNIIIFFSGHGGYDDHGQAFLTTFDIDPDLPTDRGIYYSDSPPKWAQYLKAKNILILLDACFSGASINGGRVKSIMPQRGIRLDLTSKNIGAYSRKIVILSSSNSNQVSRESTIHSQGEFTFHLLEAMKGGADNNNDGIIDLPEIADYIRDKMKAEGRQQIIVAPPNGYTFTVARKTQDKYRLHLSSTEGDAPLPK